MRDYDTGDTSDIHSRFLDGQGEHLSRRPPPQPELMNWRVWLEVDANQKLLTFTQEAVSEIKARFVAIMRGAQSYPHYVCAQLGGKPTAFKFEGTNIASAYAAILEAVLQIIGLAPVQSQPA